MSTLSDFARFPGQRFIETGTGQGDTLALAASAYQECFSIEKDVVAYYSALRRIRGTGNVSILFGDSAELLPLTIDPRLKTVFWLDAHFTLSDGVPACPLLAELRAIADQHWNVMPTILIDDRGAFLRGDHGWPALPLIEDFMVGWKRIVVDENIFGFGG